MLSGCACAVQGCINCGEDVPSVGNLLPFSDGNQSARLFKFWVRDRSGNKLRGGHIRALLYALGMGLGFSSQKFPLAPPNSATKGI